MSIEDVGLPKWPALIVVGKSVTVEQAAEILIKTSDELPQYGRGNDPEHSARINTLIGAQAVPTGEQWLSHIKSCEQWQADAGILPLNYLTNHRIVSSYVGGPHGWCDWDGTIGCNTFNVGKWPSVEEILGEWKIIAEAFPYLDLECQLCNHEAGYPENAAIPGPLVKFIVRNGTVQAIPQTPGADPYLLAPVLYDDIDFTDPESERGISIDDLRDKLLMVYGGAIPQVRAVDAEQGVE